MSDDRKPLAIGRVLGMPPRFLNGLWFVHDGAIDKIGAVFTDGVLIPGPQSDFDTSVELLAAKIPPGSYSTCLREGCFRLADDIVDAVILADVVNTKAGWYRAPIE